MKLLQLEKKTKKTKPLKSRKKKKGKKTFVLSKAFFSSVKVSS
jgi:hypothetical protein